MLYNLNKIFEFRKLFSPLLFSIDIRFIVDPHQKVSQTQISEFVSFSRDLPLLATLLYLDKNYFFRWKFLLTKLLRKRGTSN